LAVSLCSEYTVSSQAEPAGATTRGRSMVVLPRTVSWTNEFCCSGAVFVPFSVQESPTFAISALDGRTATAIRVLVFMAPVVEGS
jgi:hypothetical protein